jgi:hypothetical protein
MPRLALNPHGRAYLGTLGTTLTVLSRGSSIHHSSCHI